MQSWIEIKKIENPTEEQQLEAVKLNWFAISLIANPTPAVQKAAFEQNVQAILYVKNGLYENASDELWAEAVRVSADALKFVRDPGEAVLVAAVERDWTYLQEIEHPTALVVVAAVKQDYRAFEYVSIKNRTEAEVRPELDEIMVKEIEKRGIPSSVEFVSEMPYTGMGKIDYRKLAEDFDKRMDLNELH